MTMMRQLQIQGREPPSSGREWRGADAQDLSRGVWHLLVRCICARAWRNTHASLSKPHHHNTPTPHHAHTDTPTHTHTPDSPQVCIFCRLTVESMEASCNASPMRAAVNRRKTTAEGRQQRVRAGGRAVQVLLAHYGSGAESFPERIQQCVLHCRPDSAWMRLHQARQLTWWTG